MTHGTHSINTLMSETENPITQKVKRKRGQKKHKKSSNSSELVIGIPSMEDQCISLNWEFCSHQEDESEDLRHALLCTTLELETTINSAKEEILRRECEILNLKDLLNRAIKEKDEVEAKCGKLMFENLVLLEHHKTQELEITPQSDSDSSKFFASSDTDDNTIQSSQTDPPSVCKNACENEQHPFPQTVWEKACERPLPHKGKLLQAVIEAGPLLQNLLLAGPLPHWQHPPPLVDSVDIPPVIISPRPTQPLAQSTSIDVRKRSLPYVSDVSQHCHNKHQKVV